MPPAPSPIFSVLDLSPVPMGSTVGDALRNSLDLARHAERLGYHRYWLAEHHNMPGIASAATAVAIGHVAAGTSTIRVGSGGIMLPNHAPLMVAEAFGTLAALFPNRIDLGVGRAPGTDQATMRALRRYMGAVDSFAQDVVELQAWFRPAEPDQAVRAVPGEGQDVAIWILGRVPMVPSWPRPSACHLPLPPILPRTTSWTRPHSTGDTSNRRRPVPSPISWSVSEPA